jgi:hypothetical protein
MSKTHFKKLINPDYLGAYSLDNGQGGYTDVTATIASVKVENVTGADGKKEDCMVMRFKENRIGTVDMKPMILNITNAKTLEKLFKTPYVEDWANRRITIGTERIKAFGDIVDALRIRKTLPREQNIVKCADTGKKITATEKMTAEQIIAVTQKRYGRALCAERYMELIEQEKVAYAAPTESEQPAPAESEPAEPVESTESESGESEFEKAMKEGEAE